MITRYYFQIHFAKKTVWPFVVRHKFQLYITANRDSKLLMTVLLMVFTNC